MCEFCKNLGIGLPDLIFLPGEDSVIVPSGIVI